MRSAVSPPRPTGAEATSMAKASQTTRPSSTTNQASSQLKGSSKSKLRTATRIADEELNDFEMASTSMTGTSTPKVSLPNGSLHRHRPAQRQRCSGQRERKALRLRTLAFTMTSSRASAARSEETVVGDIDRRRTLNVAKPVPFDGEVHRMLAVLTQRTNLAARPRFDVGPGVSCSW